MEKLNINGLSDSEALHKISLLIDQAQDERDHELSEAARVLIDELDARPLAPTDSALLHYFRANAWSALRPTENQTDTWNWDQPALQEEILSLRRATRHEAFRDLPPFRQCQILTNLGNGLDTAGRFIEAIEAWDQALAIEPRFAMAIGNRALGFSHYGRAVYDPGHAGVLLLESHDGYRSALSGQAIYESEGHDSVIHGFHEQMKFISSIIPVDEIRESVDLDSFSLGETGEEQAYRSWCLSHRLFLNPLNDLGARSIAAADVLTLPNMTFRNEADWKPPAIIGFFNQIKQEFVSARFMFYEAQRSREQHYSDREVLLYNTLDFPVHSFRSERMRAAFRASYSIFDKLAYFLNSLAVARTGHYGAFSGCRKTFSTKGRPKQWNPTLR